MFIAKYPYKFLFASDSDLVKNNTFAGVRSHARFIKNMMEVLKLFFLTMLLF